MKSWWMQMTETDGFFVGVAGGEDERLGRGGGEGVRKRERAGDQQKEQPETRHEGFSGTKEGGLERFFQRSVILSAAKNPFGCTRRFHRRERPAGFFAALRMTIPLENTANFPSTRGRKAHEKLPAPSLHLSGLSALL